MPEASSSEISRLAGEALPLRANRPLVSEAAFCCVISGPALGLRPFAHGGHGGGNRRQPAAPLGAALQAVAQVVPQLADLVCRTRLARQFHQDRKSTRLNSSH